MLRTLVGTGGAQRMDFTLRLDGLVGIRQEEPSEVREQRQEKPHAFR